MFTRQHYDFIARAVRELKSASARSEIADVLARRFAQDNGGFKKERFLKAASAAPLLEEAGLTHTDELAIARVSAISDMLDSYLASTGGVK